VCGILSTPLYADVIPSRRVESTDATQKVQGRLMELGLNKDAAVSQSQLLTERETAYFSQQPERIQLVGQEIWAGQTDLLWWEWILGIVALVGPVVWILSVK